MCDGEAWWRRVWARRRLTPKQRRLERRGGCEGELSSHGARPRARRHRQRHSSESVCSRSAHTRAVKERKQSQRERGGGKKRNVCKLAMETAVAVRHMLTPFYTMTRIRDLAHSRSHNLERFTLRGSFLIPLYGRVWGSDDMSLVPIKVLK